MAFLGLGPHYFNNIIVSILSLSQLGGFLSIAAYVTCFGSIIGQYKDGKFFENMMLGSVPEDFWKDMYKNSIHYLAYFWLAISFTVYYLSFGDFYDIAIRGAAWLINYLMLLCSFTPSNLICTYLASECSLYDGKIPVK